MAPSAFKRVRGKVPKAKFAKPKPEPPIAVDTAYHVGNGGRLQAVEKTYMFEAGPSKRIRFDTAADASTSTLRAAGADDEGQLSTTPTAEANDDWEDIEPPVRKAPKAKKPKGTKISALLADWKDDFGTLGSDMLSWEAANLKLCSCGASARYRCTECHSSSPRCRKCMVRDHRDLWYHRVEHWNGDFYTRHDLSELGHAIYLGHEGQPCEHASPTNSKAANVVIGHTNGYHQCKIYYCQCPERADTISQLVRNRIMPATRTNPQSAFTVDLLRAWHGLWLTAKISSHDFIRWMTRMTDNAFPSNAKARYKEFRVVSRLYAHLTMTKRAGIYHDLSVPNRRVGDLTVPCVTCPSPGFNLPEEWKQTPDRLRYIYRIVLGGDGNHSLNKKAKNTDPDDVSLGAGQGFFVKQDELRRVLAKSYEDDDTKLVETCSGFQVTRSQRASKFRFLDLSGIVAITCSHVFFRSGAVVDLITGERYHLMDLALRFGLEGTEELLERAFTYDVICIYLRNLLPRFRENFPALVPMVENLLCCLPKFHSHAHKELCQVVYALCYSSGFGLTHGEGVETPWAEQNVAGLTTREMTTGARHDALNDLFNFWNRQKLENLGSHLTKKLKQAYDGQHRTTAYLASLTALAGPAKVSAWARMDIHTEAPTPLNYKEKEAAFSRSVYMLDRSQFPTRQTAFETLVEVHENGKNKNATAVAAELRKRAAQFIKTGIELDCDRYKLTTRRQLVRDGDELTDEAREPLTAAAAAYRDKLKRWRLLQKKQMPLLQLFDEDGEAANAEGDDDDQDLDDDEAGLLGLPSDFSSSEIEQYDLSLLATYELKIRIGLAFDQLEEVRQAVRHTSAYLDSKKTHAHGTKEHTRANTEISKSRQLSHRLADRYNNNFTRIETLRRLLDAKAGLSSDNDDLSSRLQLINKKADLLITDLQVPRTQGDSQVSGSWIWSVFEVPAAKRMGSRKRTRQDTSPERNEQPEWLHSSECAQWQRARAEKTRHDEAVNIICAEFRHSTRGFDSLRRAWVTVAERTDLPPGHVAYARQQARMYERMRDECKTAYDATRTPGADGECLDHTLSLRGDLQDLGCDLGPYEDALKVLYMD